MKCGYCVDDWPIFDSGNSDELVTYFENGLSSRFARMKIIFMKHEHFSGSLYGFCGFAHSNNIKETRNHGQYLKIRKGTCTSFSTVT